MNPGSLEASQKHFLSSHLASHGQGLTPQPSGQQSQPTLPVPDEGAAAQRQVSPAQGHTANVGAPQELEPRPPTPVPPHSRGEKRHTKTDK